MNTITTINYNEFMKNSTIIHCDTAMNYYNALEFFILHKEQIDMVTYNNTNRFLLFSTGILQTDENNNYFFEFTPKRDIDIMDNIKIEPINNNVKITYFIGEIEYDPQIVKEFVIVAASYHEFKIRLTFLEKPTENFEFFIYSRNYIMKNNIRKKLRINKLLTNSNIYDQGLCQKI